MEYNRDEVISTRVGRPKPVSEEQRASDSRDYRAQKSYADALKQDLGIHGNKVAHTRDG
ncbi:hypothetical protein Ancab_021150, partial [Ancistrocladus abbreviatus]